MMNNQNNFLDAVNILSLVIGLKNLEENREQSRHNDVKAANDQQAEFLLSDIHKKFEEQNRILEQQNRLLYELLYLMKNREENSNDI